MLKRILSIVAVMAVGAGTLWAQPMAEKVPADAIVYVGWRGASDMGPGYDQSNLKGFLEASQLPKEIGEFLPQIARKLATKDRNAAEMMRLAIAVGGAMWRHPSAVYFGGMDFSDANQPKPRLAVMVDGGDEAADLNTQLQQVMQRGGQRPKQLGIKLATYGKLVVVSMGLTVEEEALISSGNGKALAGDAAFKTAMAQVHKDPVAAAYMDGQALVKLRNDFKAHEPAAAKNRKDEAGWAFLMDDAGLKGLKHVAYGAGFVGKDWESDWFVERPEPAVGYIGGLMAAKPVSAGAYSAIPKNATMAGVGQFSATDLFHAISALSARADPNGGQKFDQAVANLNQMLGLDVDKDLLATLGQEWVYYVNPEVAGSGIMGFSIVNRLKDPAKFEKSMARVEQFSNGMMSMAGRQQGMAIAFRQYKQGELTVHYLGLPVVTPSWAVQDGNLYLALYPQALVGAAEHVAKKGASILENEKFVDLQKRMEVKPGTATSISFLDLPRTAPDAYQTLLLISRLYLGMADMFGMRPSPMIPPPLTAMTPYLDPAGSASWVDEKGSHYRHITPFPGSETLAQSGIGASVVGQNALLVSILLPSLNRARETANRVKCASNMRQIGQAMLLYSNENKSKFPADMGTLIKTEDINIDAFVCPSSGTQIPPEIMRGTPDQKSKWVNANSDYIYLGKGKKNSESPETVLLYEKQDDHGKDGMNILFGDGHVEFLAMPAAQKLIREQTGKALPDGEL